MGPAVPPLRRIGPSCAVGARVEPVSPPPERVGASAGPVCCGSAGTSVGDHVGEDGAVADSDGLGDQSFVASGAGDSVR